MAKEVAMKKIIASLFVIIIVYIGISCAYTAGHKRGLEEGQKCAGMDLYEDIAKMALSGKAIYGTVIMEPNSVLSDCLIISGGDGVLMQGTNGTITGCTMIVAEGRYAITNDPNEAAELKRKAYLNMTAGMKKLYKDWEFAKVE